MKKLRIASILIMLIAMLPGSDSAAQADSRYFPETGATVQGRFLTYWQAHGGLAMFGYPLTNQFYDIPPLAQKNEGVLVQYFERARFELHPENQPPNDVLLTLLGSQQYQTKYPSGAAGQVASSDNPYNFAQTGKTIGGIFRTYWQSHGGLSQFGYPLSNEFTQVSDLNGKSYIVQYFERAVFENHPENAGTPYQVLLSQLGTAKYEELIHNLDIWGMDVTSADEGWAGCSGSLILHYTGSRWIIDINPKGYRYWTLYNVKVLSNNEVWANDRAIYRYHDGSWQEVKELGVENSVIEDEVAAISMVSPDEGWAVSEVAGGYFLHYSSNDGAWHIASGPVNDNLFDIQMLSGSEGWAVGIAGFYHYNGTVWTQRPMPLIQGNNRHISMVSSDDGWVVTSEEKKLYHYDGSVWQGVASPTEQSLWGVAMVSHDDGWAVGDGGTILHYDGVQWQIYPSPTSNSLHHVKMVSPSEGWAVGWQGTILHYQKGVWNVYTF